MMDETIAPQVYRTNKGDRLIPLFLGSSLMLCAPVLAILSGAFFWPWGLLLPLVALVACVPAFLRWNHSRTFVRWSNGRVALVKGRRHRSFDCSELTRIEIRPSSVQTLLWTKDTVFQISHRLADFDGLLAKLRSARADLFAAPTELIFRSSLTPTLLQLGLFGGTSAAALLLASWHPLLGAVFGVSAVSVLLRALLFLPLTLEVKSGSLAVRYWLRRKLWARPTSIIEEEYAADGAVLFRLRLDYGRRRVFLDEGHLLDPVRPHARRVEALLAPLG